MKTLHTQTDPAAVAETVAQNLRLAHWAVRRYLGLTAAHPDYDDRVQDASIALWRAAEGFDPARGRTLASYAGTAMHRELAYRKLVADRHGFTRVGDGRARRAVAARPVSLDMPTTADGDPLRDLIPGATTDGVRPDLAPVWRVVGRLSNPVLREIVTLAYREGLDDAEIGRRLGRTRGAVFESRKRALAALRIALGAAP